MQWTDDELKLDLLEDQCGRVNAMVALPDGQNVLLGTPWLFPKWSGYRLEVEILRGVIARIRLVAEMWEANQLELPSAYPERMRQLTHRFIGVWKAKDFATVTEEGRELLQELLQLSDQVTDGLLMRQGNRPFAEGQADGQKGGKFYLGGRMELPSWDQPVPEVASSLETRPSDLERFCDSPVLNWIGLRRPWKPEPKPSVDEVHKAARTVESMVHKLKQGRKQVVWGPIFDVGRDRMPDGQPLGDNGENLRQELVNTLQNQLPALAGDVGLVHVISGINGVGVNGLTPTTQSDLVIEALESANTIAPYTQLMISFDQPFCERHAWSVGGQTPEYFLTKLAKQRTPLHAIGLEFNLGYFPRGTLPRTDLDWILLLQSWAIWEVPIYIMLRMPAEVDTAGRSKLFAPAYRADGSANGMRAAVQHLTQLFSSLPWIHGMMVTGLGDQDASYPEKWEEEDANGVPANNLFFRI